MARRIKLVSDGTVAGTKVFVVDPHRPDEPPQPLQRVTAVAWNIDTRSRRRLADVTLTVAAPQVELEADELTEDHKHAWDYIYEEGRARPVIRICMGCGAEQDLRDLDWSEGAENEPAA